MSGNLSLLTVLFIMCYFIKKSRNVVVYTELTRDSNGDYFTNVCKNCYEYGAILNQGVCKCEWPRSLFLRFEKRCKREDEFMLKEQCQKWEREFVEVIDTEKKDSEYTFRRNVDQPSCQLEPLISYHNSTVGVWRFFNQSGNNVLALHNGPNRFSLIKVTQVSPSLTKFKGYVMKLGLKCKTLLNKTEESCLLFKAKGKISFPLNCSSTTVTSTTRSLVTSLTTAIPTSIVTLSSCFACVPTSSPSSTKASTLPSTLVTSPTTAIPTSIVTPSSCFPVPTSSIKGQECNGTCDPLSPVIIAAIASGVTVLCLSIILVVYRYTFICRPRGLQARNPDHDFDVISNLGPQTYRIQEEPLYAEVQDISPCDKGSGSSTKEGSEEGTVLLNPNVYEARFLVPRRTTDPLPSRPELAGNTDTQVHAGAACQNDEREALGQAAEYSIVLKNPKVVEASSMSLPRSENDFTKLSGAHEQEEESIGDHHHHVVQDDTDNSTVHLECEGTGKDYQMLLQSKRAHSVFICPSCNKNPDYQRLSMTQNCPHGTKDIPKQNRESIYQSLSGPEPGSRESVYAPITKEPASEDEGNTNNEENEGLPEYHILEQEEMEVSNEDLTEPVNHDYKELERPEETGVEVDECAKDSISRDPDQTSEDSDSSIEPSKILNMEDNPAYAKPWKVKEDPELPLEPSDFLNIKNNPAYSTLTPPCTSKTAEPCLRGRAYST